MPSIQLGDVIFDKTGRPGVVVGRDPLNDQITIERHGENFEDARKRNLINGLDPEMRKTYNEIIDEIKEEATTLEKLQALETKISELAQSPQNHIVVKYLDAQKGHIMNSERVNPRTYTIDEDSVR